MKRALSSTLRLAAQTSQAALHAQQAASSSSRLTSFSSSIAAAASHAQKLASLQRQSFTSSASPVASNATEASSPAAKRPMANPLPETPPKLYSSHNPLYSWQKHLLTIGSSLASLVNPARGDMIATLSEVSGESGGHLPRLRDDMLQHDEGRRLLVERPSVNTKTVDMAALSAMPKGTLGNEYTKWLEWCRVGPDTRAKVQFISSPELAYVMQRYRECHDFYHLVCSMPVSTLGETVVKIFEASHFGLPVAYLSSIAGPLRLSAEERRMLVQELGPWAIRMGKRCREKGSHATLLSVYWEEHWTKDWAAFKREELGMDEPPPVQVHYEVKRGTAKKKKAWTTATYAKSQQQQASAE